MKFLKLQRESYYRATYTAELIHEISDTVRFKVKYSSPLSSQIWRKDNLKASSNNVLSKVNSYSLLKTNAKIGFK